MAKPGRNRFSVEMGTPQDGAGTPEGKTDRYCALCGQKVETDGPAIERFGEAFCSDGHAEEFVTAVRAARVQTAARAVTAVERSGAPAEATPGQRDWKASLPKALCWGVPLVVVAVVLAGGTGALVGAAGSILPLLAVLACPLGMYFMMRSMSKMGDHGNSKDKDQGGDR